MASSQVGDERFGTYYPPTWFWVSVSGPVKYQPFKGYLGDPRTDVSHTFRVLYIRYNLRSENPFSQTQKGSFVLVSRLVAEVKVIRSSPGSLTISNAKEPGLEPPPVIVEIADTLLMKKRYSVPEDQIQK